MNLLLHNTGELVLKEERERNKLTGSITVFLSLILLLIMSLILTVIEGARISTARVFTQRALMTAMDSVLADFYLPLWEEYHLFGLDTANNELEILDQVSEYMSYTMDPNKNLDLPFLEEGAELYDINIRSLELVEQTKLVDYQGKIFVNQATAYMKYKEMEAFLEQLMDKMSLLEKPKKISYLYEEKQELEEELVKIDEGILELMELLDGIDTSKKGIEVTKDGQLKTVSYFVKIFCNGEASQNGVGINNEIVFHALKDRYINLEEKFRGIEHDYVSLEMNLMAYQEINRRHMDALGQWNNLRKTLDELDQKLEDKKKEEEGKDDERKDDEREENNNKKEEELKEIKEQIHKIKEEIKELEYGISKIESEIIDNELNRDDIISSIINKKNELSEGINHIIPLIYEAQEVIYGIIEKSLIAGDLVDHYEEELIQAKEEIGEELFSSMRDDLLELKKYTSEEGSGYRFTEMVDCLESNLSVLLRMNKDMEEGIDKLLQEEYLASKAKFSQSSSIAKEYSHQGLSLDYSSLVLDRDKSLNPLEFMEALISEGMLALVTEVTQLSEASLGEENIPSNLNFIKKEARTYEFDFGRFFTDAAIGNKNSNAESLFGSFGEASEGLSILESGINNFIEKILLLEYLQEHFTGYSEPVKAKGDEKPKVLDYELEYLIHAGISDKENLSSIVGRIIFVRTLLDFISILGDGEKCNEAKMVAVSLVGFTGLPILVSITKTLILLIWSFAEALVDTSALLHGKEIPIIKKQLVLRFSELFLLSPSFIKEKAHQIKDSNNLSFTYEDYLYLFLLLTGNQALSLRSLDLIQENLRLRYDRSFSMQNCIFGFGLEASYIIPSRFTLIPFLKKRLTSGRDYFDYQVKLAYSY